MHQDNKYPTLKYTLILVLIP